VTTDTQKILSTPAYPRKLHDFKRTTQRRTAKMPHLITTILDWQCVTQIKKNKNKFAITECYKAVQPRITFSTKKILPAVCQDHVPTTQQSMVVYHYVCCCKGRYVSRPLLRLQEKINNISRNPSAINKNLPKRNCKEKINTTKSPQCDSVIGLHLL